MKHEHTPDIDAQAIQWFVRLRSPNATDAERSAHARWLAADERHELAYARVERQWRELEGLRHWGQAELRRLGQESRTRATRNVRFSVAGAVAAAAALACIAVWWGLSAAPVAGAEEEALRIVTQKTEQRHMMLGDGSRVHVNTASDLEVRYRRHMREVVVNNGEGLFDVDHRANRPFVVRAGHHSVIAVGTRFAVRRKHDDEWAVTVIEGRVAVVPGSPSSPEEFADLLSSAPSGKYGQRVILGPDKQLHIDGEGQIVAEQETDALATTAWQAGMLKFRQTPLREVAREISRYTLGEVRVADDVPDHPVTGIIHIRNRQTMVGYLTEVVPVTPVESGAGVTVLQAPLDTQREFQRPPSPPPLATELHDRAALAR